jgi:hypothetical protein
MKFILILLLISVSIGNLSAQESQSSELIHVMNLVDDGIHKNFKKIKNKSLMLSDVERQFVYDHKSKDALLPFLTNLIGGFGLGSFHQGDYFAGVIGLVGNGGGLALMISSGSRNSSTGDLGFILGLSTYAINLVLPWTHAGGYNSKLEEALGLEDISRIQIAPKFNLTHNGTYYPCATISISF